MLVYSLTKKLLGPLLNLGTPKNVTYFWGFGSFLGLMMIIQVFSGFLLSFYYVSGTLGWDSVIEISREVSGGWLLRLIHSNGASFVFLVMFMHILRGILQSSFYLALPWSSGLLLLILIMMSAFLGYVLPWGQMSFWGATVIINLLSILPKGKLLVIWLWGGFYVSSFTCSFFYALHFITPFVVLFMSMIHIILLHFSGSSAPGGVPRTPLLKTKFSQLFLYKDLVNLSLLWCLWLWALSYPDWSADPVNFVISDLSNSPLHIQPEWYFLNLYAILRSIPNKLGGLLGFALALVLLSTLALVKSNLTLSQFNTYNFMSWSFISVNILLTWLGMQPVEEPYVFMGQVGTAIYFSYIMGVLILDQLIWELSY